MNNKTKGSIMNDYDPMNNNGWITDKLPTEEDALDECVLVTTDVGIEIWNYERVKIGLPWKPIEEPAPYVRKKHQPEQDRVVVDTLVYRDPKTGLLVKVEPDREEMIERYREEMIDRYMEMDDKEFIEEYAKTFGDDKILAVLQDTFESDGKCNVLFDVLGEDVIDDLFDDLFESYVSVEYRRQLFLESEDRFELCSQLVDMNINNNKVMQ